MKTPAQPHRSTLLGHLDVRGWRERHARGARRTDLRDVEYVFTRHELQAVASAVVAALGDDAVALDTPVRVQQALVTLIGRSGGRGEVVVRRSPAALLTPEYWQIAVTQADRRANACLVNVLRVHDR